MPFRTDAPVVGVDELNLTHQQRTIEVHKALETAVYAVHYSDLEIAISDALEKNRPLVLSPGAVYETAQPISIANASGMNLIANGATLRATADMDRLLYINGMAYSQIAGLSLDTAAGVTVQDMIYYGWDGTPGTRSTTYNRFEGVRVRGRYVNGWRIGQYGTGFQCDHTTYLQCGAFGNWTPGETTLWQRGFLVGDGLVANNVIHAFRDCGAVMNRYNYDIDMARSVLIEGGALASAECDFLVRTMGPLSIRQAHSEGSAQFLRADDRGVEAFYTNITIEDSSFAPWDGASTLREDGRWIEMNHGGYLGLRALKAHYIPVGRPAVISVHDNALPAYIEARGLQVATTDAAQAFDVAANVTVDNAGYQAL